MFQTFDIQNLMCLGTLGMENRSKSRNSSKVSELLFCVPVLIEGVRPGRTLGDSPVPVPFVFKAMKMRGSKDSVL